MSQRYVIDELQVYEPTDLSEPPIDVLVTVDHCEKPWPCIARVESTSLRALWTYVQTNWNTPDEPLGEQVQFQNHPYPQEFNAGGMIVHHSYTPEVFSDLSIALWEASGTRKPAPDTFHIFVGSEGRIANL